MKKKRKGNWTWAFLSIKQPYFLPAVFSPFWKENFLVGLGRKHLGLTIYFPSSSPNQTYSKKFSFPFSLQGFPSILFHLQTNTPLRWDNVCGEDRMTIPLSHGASHGCVACTSYAHGTCLWGMSVWECVESSTIIGISKNVIGYVNFLKLWWFFLLL